MEQKELDRINELYRKQKSEGLTEEEKAEQKELRKRYVENFRSNFEAGLKNISIQNPDGSIIHLADRIKRK